MKDVPKNTKKQKVKKIKAPVVWEKGGPSPNGQGKPKGFISLKKILREQLMKHTTIVNPETGKREKALVGEKLMATVMEMALEDKNTHMVKMVMEYIEGKAVQPIEQRGEVGVQMNYKDPNVQELLNKQAQELSKTISSGYYEKSKNGRNNSKGDTGE